MTSRILPPSEWARLAYATRVRRTRPRPRPDPDPRHRRRRPHCRLLGDVWCCTPSVCGLIRRTGRGRRPPKLLREVGRYAPTIFAVVDPEVGALAVKNGGIRLRARIT
jgi:hypothetical protein